MFSGQKFIFHKIKINGSNDISFESSYQAESQNNFYKIFQSTLTMLKNKFQSN